MTPEDEEFERIAQKQLAALKKSTKATTEDAAVRAVHKVAKAHGLIDIGRIFTPEKSQPEPQPSKPLTDDTRRLDALDQNCWDLRCFSHLHGEDYGWRVIEHHMAKPHERTVAEVYCNDPRKAIDAAIEAAHGIMSVPDGKGGV